MTIKRFLAGCRAVVRLRVPTCAVLIGTALFAIATPATAAIKIATFTGSLYGADPYGVFGGGGSVDDPNDYNYGEWTATITYDTAGSNFYQYPISEFDLNLAASRVDNVTMLQSTFTLNGHTVTSGATGGYFVMDYCNCYSNGGVYVEVITLTVLANGDNGYNGQYGYILGLGVSSDLLPTPLSPLSFENNFPTTPVEDGDAPAGGAVGEQGGGFRYGNAAFILSGQYTVSVTDAPVVNPGPIPEPGAWALMILGFGAVGSMIRRGKAVAA